MTEERIVSENEKSNPVLFCQKWEESESGWGTRPDGYSLHRSESDLAAFIQEYWEGMPNGVPAEYSRPCGEPYFVEASAEQFEAVMKSKHGVRYYSGAHPPAQPGTDGWVTKGSN